MNGFSGLTKLICSQAFDLIWPAIRMGVGAGYLNKEAGHVVVFDPSIPYEPKYRSLFEDGFKDPFEDLVLWEHTFGNPDVNELDKYVLIASAKGYTSFLTGLPSSVVQQQLPALYVPGMTKWGGSWVDGVGPMRLISAFSGVQQHFDEMIARMMNAAIIAICKDRMAGVMASDEAMILA